MLNRVFLIGRLGQDPQIKYTPQGTPVTTFNLATDRRWKDRDGNLRSDTQWHRIVLWGSQAETAAEYLKKGSLIFVEGNIQTRSWEDKDGNQRRTTQIRALRFQFLEPKGSTGAVAAEITAEIDTAIDDSSTDDVPF